MRAVVEEKAGREACNARLGALWELELKRRARAGAKVSKGAE